MNKLLNAERKICAYYIESKKNGSLKLSNLKSNSIHRIFIQMNITRSLVLFGVLCNDHLFSLRG